MGYKEQRLIDKLFYKILWFDKYHYDKTPGIVINELDEDDKLIINNMSEKDWNRRI